MAKVMFSRPIPGAHPAALVRVLQLVAHQVQGHNFPRLMRPFCCPLVRLLAAGLDFWHCSRKVPAIEL